MQPAGNQRAARRNIGQRQALPVPGVRPAEQECGHRKTQRRVGMGRKQDSFSDHESILELAAISNAEPLSASDSARLQEHLSSCAKCREASGSFRWLYEQGEALPKPPYFGSSPSEDSWDHDAQKVRLF